VEPGVVAEVLPAAEVAIEESVVAEIPELGSDRKSAGGQGLAEHRDLARVWT